MRYEGRRVGAKWKKRKKRRKEKEKEWKEKKKRTKVVRPLLLDRSPESVFPSKNLSIMIHNDLIIII